MARACASQSLCGGVSSAADDTVLDPPSRKHTEARLTFERISSGSGTKTLGCFEFAPASRAKGGPWVLPLTTRPSVIRASYMQLTQPLPLEAHDGPKATSHSVRLRRCERRLRPPRRTTIDTPPQRDRSTPWDCPMKLVVCELSDAITVSGSCITQPWGPGGESEVHDPERAPSPPQNRPRSQKREVGTAPISVTVPVTKRIREFDAVRNIRVIPADNPTDR
jgi:hypothetical protein